MLSSEPREETIARRERMQSVYSTLQFATPEEIVRVDADNPQTAPTKFSQDMVRFGNLATDERERARTPFTDTLDLPDAGGSWLSSSFEFDDPTALGEGQGSAGQSGAFGPQGPYDKPSTGNNALDQRLGSMASGFGDRNVPDYTARESIGYGLEAAGNFASLATSSYGEAYGIDNPVVQELTRPINYVPFGAGVGPARAATQAVGGRLAVEAAQPLVEKLPEGVRPVADLAINIVGQGGTDALLNRSGGAIGMGIKDVSGEESLLVRLARTNKIRASQGKPPLDAIPVAWLRGVEDDVAEAAAPVVAAAKELTPDEVARIQQKVAREGMTTENKALLDDALGRLFKVADDVPAAPPPIPINPQVSGNLDRLMNPGKLEGQAQTVEDALARARFDGPTTAPVSVPGRAALDASRNAEQAFLDEFGSGPVGKGTTLQARVIPGLTNSASTGAVLGAAGGYGTTDEDATPLQTAQNVAKGALMGMAIGSIAGTGANRVAALQAARKLNGLQGQLGIIPGPRGKMQAGKELAQDIFKVFSPSELLNLTRTTASSMDFSGTLRQGGYLGARHKTALKDMFAAQVKAVVGPGGEQRAQAMMRDIERAPLAPLRRGLYMSDWNGTNLSQREEAFASSLASEIPGVAATSRGYAIGLNKMRADVFDSVVASWPESMRTPERLERYQRYVEAASGRGSIPEALEGLAGLLNGMFFSSRFIASIPQRHLGGVSNGKIGLADPLIRKEVIKDMASFYGTGLTILGLAMAAKTAFDIPDSKLRVPTDPDDSAWGKIVAGPTKVDIWGGNQQFARMMTRVGTSSPAWIAAVLNGEVKDLKASENPLRIIEQFLTYKLSPNAQMLREAATGKDALGQPAAPIVDSFIQKSAPMTLGDLADTYNVWLNRTRNPAVAGAATGASALGNALGVGVSTYEDSKRPQRAGGGGLPALPKLPAGGKMPGVPKLPPRKAQ